jgi:5-methylcytosine-specific restriction endonuclease McrA
MLPESRTLKAADADKHRVSTKRSVARSNPKLRYDMVEGSAPQGAVTRPVRALFLEMDVAVFVLDRRGKALMPCSEKRARLLLERGRARVHRVLPFVIRLIDRSADTCTFQALRLKLDPGSKVSGMALVREFDVGVAVLNLFDLMHRGRQISEALTARASMRRGRRGRNTRYRAPQFLNRRKPTGWLAPSLQHRVDTTMAWVRRLCHWAPVTALSMEVVRFDMQAMENPEISGVEYQQGTLAGYELREYLLEKWGRKCMYCDKEGVPLQVEHIHAKACGGTDRPGNLGIACQPCNQKKAARDIREFLNKNSTRLARIQAQAKWPLKDAAAVNATRWALLNRLKATGLEVEASSGGRTKYNRCRLNVPKTHALDAVCVGAVEAVTDWLRPTLAIKATGRGAYQRTLLDKYGFPRGYLMRVKSVEGFQTGDMVRATVPSGKKAGSYRGRVAVRASGNFNIQNGKDVVQGISYRYCTMVQRADGYGYSFNMDSIISAGAGHATRAALSLPDMNVGVSRATSR